MRTPLTPESLRTFIELTAGALSPLDGSVAVCATTEDGLTTAEVSRLWWSDTTGHLQPAAPGDGGSQTHPAWHPDGSAVAYVAAPPGEAATIRLLARADGVSRPAWSPAGGCAGTIPPRWSPDGHLLVHGRMTAPDPVPAVMLVDTDVWQLDGLGIASEAATETVALRARGLEWEAEVLPLRPAVTLDLAWSPSGRSVLRLALDPDLSATFVLEVHDLGTGDTTTVATWPRLVYPPVACWSDEDEIVMTTAWDVDRQLDLRVWRRGAVEDKIIPVPVPGPGQVFGHIEAAANRDLAAPRLLPDRRRGVLLTIQERGTQRVVRVGLDDGTCADVLRTGATVRAIDQAAGRLLVTVGDFDQPLELAVLPLPPSVGGGSPEHLDIVPAPRPSIDLPEVTVHERSFHGPGGVCVDTWLLTPPGRGPWPVVMRLHGGPFVGNGHAFSFDDHVLLAAGLSVMLVNFRGSSGYGQDFAASLRGGWGPPQQEDVLSALLGWEEEGLVDGARVAAFGASGGGYLTLWLAARTRILRAGVAEVPVADWTSMYASDIPELVHAWVGDVPGEGSRGAAALAEAAPLTHLAGACGDLLLIAHLDDRRCPPAQVEMTYNSLRLRGHPVRMLRLPGLAHNAFGVGNLDVRIERLRIVLGHLTSRLR